MSRFSKSKSLQDAKRMYGKTHLEIAIQRCNDYIKTGATKEEKQLRRQLCENSLREAKELDQQNKDRLKQLEKEKKEIEKEDKKMAKEVDNYRKFLKKFKPFAYGD